MMEIGEHVDLHFCPSVRCSYREILSGVQDQSGFYNMQLGFAAPASGATANSFLPLCNSSTPVSAAATSESGLTYNNLPAATPSRKRPRYPDCPLPFLGEDFSSILQQQMLDVDRLILHHVDKVKVELTERVKRFLRRILAVVEESLSKRLKAKEDEIDRMSKLNWALQERIKSLCVENQMWRELARSNEAAAQVLRANLEQALAAVQVKAEEDVTAAAVADDAESCCCGDNAEDEVKMDVGSGAKRVCRWCQEREPAVLLLPCRHLCLCAACGPAVVACPVCNCMKNGSVLVNMY